jgi:serine/threonine protein kinase
MNRYQVGEAIGKGGFATVYRALDMERGDFVAIKQIEKRLLASEQLPKIMQEAELLKSLSHHNIVGFRGSVETPKHIHFVLEFVEGGSLYRVVKKFGNFTEKLCAIYLKQVLLGLAYLHGKGVVHRWEVLQV